MHDSAYIGLPQLVLWGEVLVQRRLDSVFAIKARLNLIFQIPPR